MELKILCRHATVFEMVTAWHEEASFSRPQPSGTMKDEQENVRLEAQAEKVQ